MQRRTAQQMHGAVDLLNDAVQGAVGAISASHHEIAAVPYSIMRSIPLVAAPAGAVEHIQTGITRSVYRSIGIISVAIHTAATRLLQAIETKPEGTPL